MFLYWIVNEIDHILYHPKYKATSELINLVSVRHGSDVIVSDDTRHAYPFERVIQGTYTSPSQEFFKSLLQNTISKSASQYTVNKQTYIHSLYINT